MENLIADVLADPAVTAAGTAIGGAVVALWLAAAWWAYSDASRRTNSALAALVAAAWIILSTPLLVPLALGVYVLARPLQTAAEHRSRDLVAELVDQIDDAAVAPACPSCRADVDPSWLRCPACTSWLALPCASCGSWSDRSLAACPFCGAEEREPPYVEDLAPVAPSRLRARRVRRGMRAVGPGSPQVHPQSGRRQAGTSAGRVIAPLRAR